MCASDCLRRVTCVNLESVRYVIKRRREDRKEKREKMGKADLGNIGGGCVVVSLFSLFFVAFSTY